MPPPGFARAVFLAAAFAPLLAAAPACAAGVQKAAAFMRSVPHFGGGYLNVGRLELLKFHGLGSSAEIKAALADPAKLQALSAAGFEQIELSEIKSRLETLEPILSKLPEPSDDSADQFSKAAEKESAAFVERINDQTYSHLHDGYLSLNHAGITIDYKRSFRNELWNHMLRYDAFISQANKERYRSIEPHIAQLAKDNRPSADISAQAAVTKELIDRTMRELEQARPSAEQAALDKQQDERQLDVSILTGSWELLREPLEEMLKNDSLYGHNSFERLQIVRIADDLLQQAKSDPDALAPEDVRKLDRLLRPRLELLKSRYDDVNPKGPHATENAAIGEFLAALRGLQEELPTLNPTYAEIPAAAHDAIRRLQAMRSDLKPFDRLAYEARRAATLAEEAELMGVEAAARDLPEEQAADWLKEVEDVLGGWLASAGKVEGEVNQYRDFEGAALRIAFFNSARAVFELIKAKSYLSGALTLMNLTVQTPGELKATYDGYIGELRTASAALDRQIMSRWPELADLLIFSRPPSK